MRSKNAFTLLEVLLVVAILGILAGIVIIAINPSKQLAEGNNAQRKADVNTIINALYQYSLDSNGTFPSGITSSAQEICATGVAPATCVTDTLLDLSVLTTSELYLVAFPIDPAVDTSTDNGIGYTVERTPGNRLLVNSPDAELSETIQVSL